ncbi:MAG: M20/M25/M40 family metallo-hydrolase [Candidatus Bathyarchaeota archaeon]|nr:M20/M25/M40 family metallo-hydrolase [Candidatus Bathyarchaeota archaeon]
MENASSSDTISLLSELIQNKCVNPPGDELKSIKTVQRRLREHGIESRVFESAPNRGNLVARIKGDDGPRLMFGPAHVDVVPVENVDSWEEDPFSGIVKDGYVWGRGALDMLFIVAAQVQAFIELHEEGFHPRGELILLVVSDEETGGTHGVRWMIENHPELVEADYAVTEAGGISIAPGKIAFMIGEKGVARKRISFKGKAGHGSMPYLSDNAVVKLSEAVTRLSRYSPPLTTEYLGHIAEGLGLGFVQRLMLTNPWLLPLTLGRLRSSEPMMARMVHGLSRMTVSPNIVHGGVKVNIIPETAYVDLDIRTLPGQDEDYVISHLRKALGPLADEAAIEDPPGDERGLMSFGSSSPARSEFVDAMEKAVRKEIPGGTLVPLIMPGATDCRFMREQGVEAYGFSLFDPETPPSHLADLAHGSNERVSVRTVELTQRVYRHLAKDFLK